MHKTLKSIAFMMAVILASLITSPVHAQENLTPAQKYAEWKVTEKRVFDINRRTIRIQSSTIIGFVVLFLCMVILFIRQGWGGALGADDASKKTMRILKNQKDLNILLSELKEFEVLKQSESRDIAELIESSKKHLDTLQKQIELEEKAQPTA